MHAHDPFAHIRANVIGEGAVIEGPYGPRRMTYCDHAASGRGYRPIEAWLTEVALPTYGNTHTETSAVGAQTTAFREEARKAIKVACRCGPDDVVVFTGNGATGAISTLLHCMGLGDPCDPTTRPVVLIGPYEHHSIELAAREAHCDVEVVAECQVDGIDLDDLASRLEARAGTGRRLIGMVSAGSNVTGRITNVPAVARVLHDHGAVALFDYAAAGPLFDYAAAGPYVDVRMSCPEDPLSCPDATFLSMHKFLGGPGAPGVLLAKNHLFQNAVPAVPGGGTISYVSPHKHTYLKDVEHREEGGTPNILGAMRAGLAMALKSSVNGLGLGACLRPAYADGTPYGRGVGPVGTFPPEAVRPGGACDPSSPRSNRILEHEQAAARTAINAWRRNSNLVVLGDPDTPRLGIVSVLVRKHRDGRALPGGRVLPGGRERYLHHNFVVALLNDLFGIQARGGNSCAAPYAHRLLGVSDEAEAKIEAAVEAGWHGCKPGWTRLSFGWYDSPETLDFVIRAVQLVADLGWKFLPEYSFDPKSGTWRHRRWRPALRGLLEPAPAVRVLPESVRERYLADFVELAEAASRVHVPVERTPFEALRWFWLPGEL